MFQHLDYPVAVPVFRRVFLLLVALDLLLIGTHVVLSLAWKLDLMAVQTVDFRITRNGSWADLYMQAKWAAAGLSLWLVFRRTRVAAFGALAAVCALVFLDVALRLHQTAGWRLAEATGWGPAAKLLIFAALGAVALALLLPTLRRVPDALWPQVLRFLGVLSALVALGVVFDFVHAFLARLGRLVDQAGGLVEDGGEMMLVSLATAYAVAAWRWAGGASRGAMA